MVADNTKIPVQRCGKINFFTEVNKENFEIRNSKCTVRAEFNNKFVISQ